MATTTPVPNLVRVSKLDTEFLVGPDCTQHFKFVSSGATERRRIRKEERWTVEKRVGRGGFGSVWLERCTHGDGKGDVRAVKKIPKVESSDYYRELEAISLFSHSKFEEYFVKSFGWYDDDDAVYISMEYLPYGDLQQYLHSPLPEKEGQLLVFQVLEGLRCMHENQFTHRDLKPANLLVASKGPDWWVKIADFGISKRATEGITALRTQTGTPTFAAPEVLGFFQPGDKAHDSYTNAVDIWSLGVIAFLILTGDTPFKDQRRLGQYVAGAFTFSPDVLTSRKVSAEGCELIENMMAPRSVDRLGATECLDHLWLKRLTNLYEDARYDVLSPYQEAIGLPTGGQGYSLHVPREDKNVTSLQTLIDTSDPEPSATWSTEDQVSTRKAAVAVDMPKVGVGMQRARPRKPIIAPQVCWKLQTTIRGHADWLMAVDFSNDGEQVLSASNDGTIKVWDSFTGRERGIQILPREVAVVAFSPDKKQAGGVTSLKGEIAICEIGTGDQQRSRCFKSHNDLIKAIAFSPDGKQITVGSYDKTIKVWDSDTKELVSILYGHKGPVTAVAFSPDGRLIASGSEDYTVKIWHLASGMLKKTLKSHEKGVRSVAFCPDSKLVASGSLDDTVKLWDLATGTLYDTLEGHKQWVTAVQFSPDGKLIASGSKDKKIKLWDSVTGTLCATLRGHTDWIRTLAFSPDGYQIASGSDDKTIKIWCATI